MRPEDYEAWYHTPRGRWMGETEFRLIGDMLSAAPGDSVLDAGCGTGYFTRLLAAKGLRVTGADIDADSIMLAKGKGGGPRYVLADARALPFGDGSFGQVIAMTSLCFAADPAAALRESLRVARGRVLLGLLNRRSLLYRQKRGRGGYAGARWDTAEDVKSWLARTEGDFKLTFRYAIHVPSGSFPARIAEKLLGDAFPFGGFMAALIEPERRP